MASESPLRLNDQTEPVPDIMVHSANLVSPDVRVDSVLLVVEVAESSLGYDLKRTAAVCAANGVPEYWVINARDLVTRVHRGPSVDGYRGSSTLRGISCCRRLLPGNLRFACPISTGFEPGLARPLLHHGEAALDLGELSSVDATHFFELIALHEIHLALARGATHIPTPFVEAYLDAVEPLLHGAEIPRMSPISLRISRSWTKIRFSTSLVMRRLRGREQT